MAIPDLTPMMEGVLGIFHLHMIDSIDSTQICTMRNLSHICDRKVRLYSAVLFVENSIQRVLISVAELNL